MKNHILFNLQGKESQGSASLLLRLFFSLSFSKSFLHLLLYITMTYFLKDRKPGEDLLDMGTHTLKEVKWSGKFASGRGFLPVSHRQNERSCEHCHVGSRLLQKPWLQTRKWKKNNIHDLGALVWNAMDRVGYSSWGRKESDMTEWAHTHVWMHKCILSRGSVLQSWGLSQATGWTLP